MKTLLKILGFLGVVPKLYVWRPKGFGDDTLFTIAFSERQAERQVSAFVEEKTTGEDGMYCRYSLKNWVSGRSGRYDLEVYDVGGVSSNSND